MDFNASTTESFATNLPQALSNKATNVLPPIVIFWRKNMALFSTSGISLGKPKVTAALALSWHPVVPLKRLKDFTKFGRGTGQFWTNLTLNFCNIFKFS